MADVDDAEIALLERAFVTLSSSSTPCAGRHLADDRVLGPAARIRNADGWPVPGTYAGYDGFRQWFDETFGEYSGYVPIRAEYTRVGDRIVAWVHSRWSGPEGEEVVPQVALRFQVRDGRIARMDVFIDERRALNAGLA